MFVPSPATGAFRQGEILSDVLQVHVQMDIWDPRSEEVPLGQRTHPQAIIVTQDCDLDWDFKARSQPEEENRLQLKLVPNILLCEMIPDATLRGRMSDSRIRGSDLWKRIVDNRDERYHYFPTLAGDEDRTGEGLPPMVVDFKRVFTIQNEELYRRLTLGVRRRAVLQMPFLHHFSSRFAYYCQRVALPEPIAPEITEPAGPVAPVLDV